MARTLIVTLTDKPTEQILAVMTARVKIECDLSDIDGMSAAFAEALSERAAYSAYQALWKFYEDLAGDEPRDPTA